MKMPSHKRSKSKSRKSKKRSKSGSRKRSRTGKRKSRKGARKYKSTKTLQYVYSHEGLGGNRVGFPSRAAMIAALKKSSCPEEDYVKKGK
jgi:hypothetical protein